MPHPLIRANLSSSERSLRSRIAQLASTHWFLRGSVSDRSSKCGKPNCHCAKGDGHPSVYLVQSHAGKFRQFCIPKLAHPHVRQAVADYQEMLRLIDQVSELEWSRLQERKR